MGKLEESERTYLEVLDSQGRIYDGEHALMARTLVNLSNVLFDSDRQEEGIAKLQQATELLHRTLGTGHRHTVMTEVRLARRLTAAGQARQAEIFLHECLDAWRSMDLVDKDRLLAEARDALAEASAALSL